MKKIILSILACAAVLIGCTPEEPVNPGDLDIDVVPSLLNFDGKTAGSAEIEVTAKAAWSVSVPEAAAEWLTVNPTSGGAGTVKVTVSVLVGGDAARSAEVVFKAGNDKKILSVNQEGGVVWGTVDNPYTCAKACEFCATLADKAKGPKEVYVKGIITKIVEPYGTQYGNATFFMSDDGTENSPQFEVYRALYFDNKKYDNTADKNISIGDQVVVYGMIMNYGGQAETSQNEAYLVSLEAGTLPVLSVSTKEITVAASDTQASFEVDVKNISGGWTVSTDAAWITDYTKSGTESGKVEIKFEANTAAERTAEFVVKAAGVADVTVKLTQLEYQENGTAEKPYTAAEALAVINALEDGAKTPAEVYVQGVISSIKEVSAQYGNATYNISATGADQDFITVFRGKYLEGAAFTDESQLAVGDVVVVKGQLQKYVKNGAMTPQVATGSALVSLDRPLNVAKALEEINKLNDGQTADEVVLLRGIVVGDNGIDTAYGNATFKLSDDGSDASAVTVFRAKSFDNEKFTTNDVFKKGDILIVKGQLQKYVKNGAMTPELCKGWLVAVQPGEGGSASESPELYLNEFDCKAKQLEIYNASDKEVDIAGWKLVKDGGAEDKDIFTIPASLEASKVPAKGYAVFTCKQSDAAKGPLFGLSGTKGFKIELKNGDTVVDVADNLTSITEIPDGKSWGRKTDGAAEFVLFDTPTIGAANGASAAASGITIDGDMSDWASISGAAGTGGYNASFKVASDDKNIYFYVKRTTERMSEIWGGACYHYYCFDTDNNPATGVELWGNGPYELLLVVYPYAGSASAPAFGIAAAGTAAPDTYKVDNAVIKGVVTDSGVETEVAIPRADILAMPSTPVNVYYWSNKGGSEKLEVTCTL